jgi:uncharacterized protein (TIGR03067 family)
VSNLSTHPTNEVLNDFVLGKLPDSEDDEVAHHLAECQECQQRAAVTPSGDTLVELLASAGTRFDAERGTAPTPSLFAHTQAWGGPTPAAPAAVSASLPRTDRPTDVPVALAGHPKYRIVRRLGEGGMGTVWLAEHTVMHRSVAVKVIRPELLAKPGATDRFLREVRAAAQLHHPNIVTAYDAESVGDSCLLVMEYVDGLTLADRLGAGPLPVAEACRAVRDAARGLAHAHAAGLVHRDVKPHNLIQARDGTTKVLDFGLAGAAVEDGALAVADGLTGAGMVCGTPDYIAPEQIVDPHAADARSDLYGLGCTLYHLLAGRPPFGGTTVRDKLAAQEKLVPPPIPDLAPDLAAILAKMLSKRPADRYQTADEVAAALEAVIAHTKPGPAAPHRSGRKRWMEGAAALVLAALLAGAVVFKVQRDNQEITIATDDPDVEVVMKRKGDVLRIIDNKSGERWELDTTTNQIGLADAPDGLRFELPQGAAVIVRRRGTRDGKPAFTITRTPAPPRDRELILGTWEAVAAEANGEPAPKAALDALKPTITFQADKFNAHPGAILPKHFLDILERALGSKETVARLSKGVEGVYKLDPAKAPRTIDLTVLGDDLRRDALGLYELEGDTLKVCLALNPENVAERPTEFSSKPKGDSVRVVVTFKRRAPEKVGTGAEVEMTGRLFPVELVTIYPPREGEVRDVRVKPGDRIAPGQECIALYSSALAGEYQRVLRDLAEANAQVAAATELLSKPNLREEDKLRALTDKKTAESRVEKALADLRAMDQRYNNGKPNKPGHFRAGAPPAVNRAGPDGAFRWTVLAGDRREQLVGRTVRPSDELLHVGHLEGPWHIEVLIPQRALGRVLGAFADPRAHAVENDPVRGKRRYLVAEVRLASRPGTAFEGRLYRDELPTEVVPNRGTGDGPESVAIASVKLDANGIPEGDRVPREQLVVGLEARVFLFRVPEAPAPRPRP